MVKKYKSQKPDIVFDKNGMGLSTQPNQITDLRMAPTLYTERAMDELMWTLQPFYAAAKRKENRQAQGTQLMLPFNKEDAYLVTADSKGEFQNEGDFIATIRFRDLPGITPRHYGELRQVLRGLRNVQAEVHGENGVLTTNLLDIIEEYETHEVIDPRTGEARTVKSNNLKRNEVKIRIRSEILQHNFFLTDSGYTQFYFPTTRHTKTATANRLYKWLSKWRGIKKDQMVMATERQPDGTERSVGHIVFDANYMEVRDVCGLFNSQDGKFINGEEVETVAANYAKSDGIDWTKIKAAAREPYMERARQKLSEKYAYYSEFAKRYLAQAKKELDDLSAREIADFTFDYRAIFADGRSKGKVPLKVRFTLTIFDLGQQLYENKELSAKESHAKELMKTRLNLRSEDINAFIRKADQPCDIDHLLDKLNYLVDTNTNDPRDDVQHWACACLRNFFDTELPQLHGYVTPQEVSSQPISRHSRTSHKNDILSSPSSQDHDEMEKW